MEMLTGKPDLRQRRAELKNITDIKKTMILQRNSTGNMGRNGWFCAIRIMADKFPARAVDGIPGPCYSNLRTFFRA